MRTRKWLTLTVVAGMAQVGALAAYLWHDSRPSAAAAADDGAGTGRVTSKPDASAAARRPIDDDSATRTAADECDQMAAALRAPGEDYNRAFSAGVSGSDPGPPNKFLQVVRDWRCAKLSSLLKALPPDVAAKKAIELLDENIRIVNADLGECIGQWRLKGNADRPFFMAMEHHAVCCLFFLCGNYCEPDDVLKRVDMFNSSGAVHRAAVLWNPTLGLLRDEVDRYSQLDPLFEVNLYLMMIERKGRSTATISGLPPHRESHRVLGSGLADREFSVVRSFTYLTEDARLEIVQSARKALDDCK